MFVRNAWYVGAWDHEVGRDMLRRIILNEPVVFFRRDDGVPIALEDRCCHRQAPLPLGKLIGNIVQCPYHGLQFDQTGACVKIPSARTAFLRPRASEPIRSSSAITGSGSGWAIPPRPTRA